MLKVVGEVKFLVNVFFSQNIVLYIDEWHLLNIRSYASAYWYLVLHFNNHDYIYIFIAIALH